MRWLLDSNVFIDAFAGEPNAVRLLEELRPQNPEWIGYSTIARVSRSSDFRA